MLPDGTNIIHEWTKKPFGPKKPLQSTSFFKSHWTYKPWNVLRSGVQFKKSQTDPAVALCEY